MSPRRAGSFGALARHHTMRIILLCLGISVGLLSSCNSSQVREKWKALVQEGDKRVAAGAPADAQNWFEKALQADIPPEQRWPVLFALGTTYLQTNDWTKA